MDNIEEKNEYYAIYKREVSRYMTTPLWRVIARSTRMSKVRRAAANLSYAGGTPEIPLTARQEYWFVPIVIVLIVVIGFVSIQFIGWAGTWNDPPAPLDRSITRQGTSYLIAPEYTRNHRIDVHDLCKRMPDWIDFNRSIDHYVKSLPDGSIKLTCVFDN